MQKRIMRLIAGAMIGWMLMASGELSGAVAMPESAKWANVETVQENQPATIDLEKRRRDNRRHGQPESAAAALDSASNSEKQAANTNPRKATRRQTPLRLQMTTSYPSGRRFGLRLCVYAGDERRVRRIPVFCRRASDSPFGAVSGRAADRLSHGRHEAVFRSSERRNGICAQIYGTGSGRIEIARDALSRCYDQPLEMDEGGEYKKAIARAGDVHWYTVRAASDGDKLISVLPSEEGVRLSARLVSDSGEILAESDDLEMGACFLSAFFAAGHALQHSRVRA